MVGRVNYKTGDVFHLALDANGNLGYGRILLIDKPSIFIELYEVMPSSSKLDMKNIKNMNTLFSVWSTDNGFKKGLWTVFGNLPVEGEVKIPDFWTTDAFTDKVLLIRGNERIEITRDDIGDLDPAGIYGHDAVRLTYINRLKIKGLYIIRDLARGF